MSAKLELYNDFISAMNDIEEINHAGLWNNQISHEDAERPYRFPAVFLEFSVIEFGLPQQDQLGVGLYGNIRKQEQPATCEVIVHCIFSKIERASDSFSIIDPVIDKIYLGMQNLEGDYFQKCQRISETQDVEHELIIDWQLTFRTALSEVGELNSLTETELTGTTITMDLEVQGDFRTSSGSTQI